MKERMATSSDNGTYGSEPVVPEYTKPDGTTKTTVTYSGTLSDGSEFGPSTEPPTEAGNYVVTVVCETPDTIHTGSSEFTIAKATPELGDVIAKDLHETTNVDDVVLKRSNTTVPGTFKLEETELTSGTNTYHWTFEPDDTKNYESVSGTVSITVTQHLWSDWETVKEATTEETGLKEHTCKVCGDTEQEVIKKLDPQVEPGQQEEPQQEPQQQEEPKEEPQQQEEPKEEPQQQEEPKEEPQQIGRASCRERVSVGV